MFKPFVYDAVIVGSGPTGGLAARTLGAAGLNVLVLDAGRGRREQATLSRYDALRRRLGYRIEEDPRAVRRQRVQSSCYAWPKHPHAFINDEDLPYMTPPGHPFAWIRSRQIGGRMAVRGHGLQFYRMSDHDFRAGERDGASPAWPISYGDLAPYYEGVERWMRLRGTRDGLCHLPDSILAGEVPLNAGERQLKRSIEQTWTDRRLIAGRTAAPPLPIHDALASRRCRLRANAIVTHVTINHQTGKASGVGFRDRLTGRCREVRARVVVLCASSIESARLLLLSTSRQHPNGLANSSDAVGRFLMDHTHLTGIHAEMRLDQPVASPSWAYIPRFHNLEWTDGRFVRGFGVQVFTMWRECAVTAFGEMLPHRDNRVTLDTQKQDRWGIPVARVACVHRANELAMLKPEIDACTEILGAARFEATGVKTELSPPGLANHEVGTARMGASPGDSVLNSFCQAWDVKNLFVMDGSCFVSQGVQNPTLTMLALTARSCDYLLEGCRRGDL